MNKQNKTINERDGDAEILIHAVTVYHIFRACFKKSGILDDDGNFEKRRWPSRLKEQMVLKMPEYTEVYWNDYQNYMRDRYNETRRFIEEDRNPKRLIGFERYRFAPLLKFAGIKDYKKVDDALMLSLKTDSSHARKVVVNPYEFNDYITGNEMLKYPHFIAVRNLTILIF